ncbi:MAG: hypothetical protein M1372_03135 [Patescibacteria group bacterium]|nr:hypothetical protein [Patescibacteria group bacterium]
MEGNKLFIILIQTGAFISAFAGITAGIVMANVTKKFGTGILASGFKSIAIGVILIALGIITDAIQAYFQNYNNLTFITILISVKEILFVAGTYIIVIGSKKTGDKLENLIK